MRPEPICEFVGGASNGVRAPGVEPLVGARKGGVKLKAFKPSHNQRTGKCATSC